MNKCSRFASTGLIFFYLLPGLHGQNPNFVWAKRMGGISDEIPRSITVDNSGNVCTTGDFQSTVDFDPGPGTFNLTSAGVTDVFVQKLDASGNLLWAKQMGGASNDYGSSITTDAAGNIYITGHFAGIADFDPGTGVFNLASAGNADIFILKLDATGNLLWVTRTGGNAEDFGYSVITDVAGNSYITGHFWGTVDFDPGAGTFNLTSSGSYEIFIQKLDPSGNLLWAKQTGGTSGENAYSITLDVSGNILTTGRFSGTTDFDPGAGTYNLTAAGLSDAFVQKLDPSGNLLWAKQLGGTDDDYALSVTTDAGGNSYTTGYFYGTADFDPGAGILNLTSAGNRDIYIVKLDPQGNLEWVRQTAGVLDDFSWCIHASAAGSIYITGFFFGTLDFDPGAGVSNLTAYGASDVFIQKLDASGNFVWAKQLGGMDYDSGYSITTDASGNIYTSGFFWATADFDPGAVTFNLTSAGHMDIFIQKMGQTVGMAENDIDENMVIYPNPASNNLHVQINTGNYTGRALTIYNSFGEEVLAQKFTTDSFSIDVSAFPSGLYAARIFKDHVVEKSIKIIIER